MCCLGFGFLCDGAELQKVFIYISINKFLHSSGPGESRDVCGVSSAWYSSPDQISKLAPHWSWIHIINVKCVGSMTDIMNYELVQLYSCIRDASLSLLPLTGFLFLHACLQSVRHFCHVQANVFKFSVSLSCRTTPYWTHFHSLDLRTFWFKVCCGTPCNVHSQNAH